jgi:oligopeptide transport system permease protein
VILSRVLFTVFGLVLAVLATFFLLRLFPGGPFDEEGSLAAPVRAKLEKQYGIHEPVTQQVQKYIFNIFRGEWGQSIVYAGKPVQEVVLTAMPRTLFLGAFALMTSLGIGLTMGFLFFLSPSAGVVAWIHRFFLSAPTLFLGPLLILVFGLWLGWLPIAAGDSWTSYILPVFLLAIRPSANLARLLMSAMEESLDEPWAQTAKAMGLRSRTIVMKYALRESLIPVLSYLGPALAGVFSGSLIVENIFNIQGLGTLFLQSIVNRDYALIVSLTLFYAFILMISNGVFEAIGVWADPRLRNRNEN